MVGRLRQLACPRYAHAAENCRQSQARSSFCFCFCIFCCIFLYFCCSFFLYFLYFLLVAIWTRHKFAVIDFTPDKWGVFLFVTHLCLEVSATIRCREYYMEVHESTNVCDGHVFGMPGISQAPVVS